MFIKRKAGAGKVYALSISCEFLDVGNLKSFLKFAPDTYVLCEVALVRPKSTFCRTLPDVRC